MKINAINTKLNFKNNIRNSEIEIQKQQNRNLGVSLAIGAAASILYSAKTKNPLNNIKTIEFGSVVTLGLIFASDIITLVKEAYNGAKQHTEYKQSINYDEMINKYEKGAYEGLNGFDKFVNSLVKPMPKDFGDEEKNKEYYLKTKKDMAKLTKSLICTAGATGIAAVAIAALCKIKKLPNIKDAVLTGSLITGTVGAIISLLSYSISKAKNDKSQDITK